MEICLADFAVFRVFWGISRDFEEMPEFRGSATARNIRSTASGHVSVSKRLSKVAGCRRKLPPTWLESAGYSAWHFFTDGIF